MRILVVHGRYRSAAPSGENNVVDRESAALAAAGHDVHRFERHSDEIDGWSTARKATLPVKVIWNGESRRDLAACLAEVRPDVVHVHNTFPMLSPSVLHACRDARIPVVATIHNYKLLCASGDFFREGQPCHSCASGTQLPALRHGCYRGSRAATLSVVASTTVHRAAWRELVSAYIFISAAQRDLMKGLALPPERAFVKHNFVPSVDAPPRVGGRHSGPPRGGPGAAGRSQGNPPAHAGMGRLPRCPAGLHPPPRGRRKRSAGRRSRSVGGTTPLGRRARTPAARRRAGASQECSRGGRALTVGGDVRAGGRRGDGGRGASDRAGARIVPGARDRRRGRGAVRAG